MSFGDKNAKLIKIEKNKNEKNESNFAIKPLKQVDIPYEKITRTPDTATKKNKNAD
ncbi:hypothetical protein ACN2ZS_003388 [Escherichia coli]|nr:hypothetical protein [Escherichia coli]